ncbi:MAG: 30S ribosomal protein S21 [Candidatus Omnitrophota bacterium]|nr:MAG: 30S ribosomal protein S21 [Candidatus Omnitrophota bacterium]
MAEVTIEGRGDFERALKKFRMQCKKEGIVKKFKERQRYTKPSQKRREKAKRRKKG